MNKLKYILSTVLIGLFATSCVDMLDDNINPDKAHAVTAQTGLPVIVFYAQQATYDHAEYYIYLSQCLTTTGKSAIGTYSYKSEWEFLTMNRHPQWRRHFYDIGSNVNNLIANSKDMGSPNYELIARTVRLLSTQLATDMFGEMPLTNAYQSNSPTYDTQASIYAWMFKEIDELISMYEDPAITQAAGNQTIDVVQDRVYAGDLNKWKGLVYAVKARLLLRNLPNIDTSAATCQKIIDAADAAINQWRSGDLLYGSWFGNEPRYNFDGGTNEQNCVWSSAQPIINSWESRKNLLDSAVPSKFFVVDCLGLHDYGTKNEGSYDIYRNGWEGYANDPRLQLLMIARKGPDGDVLSKIRHVENNIGIGTSYKVDHYPSLYMGAYAGSISGYNPIFTMEELYFIKAEAEYWKGNKTAACALAKEATQNNIQRHLDFFLANHINEKYDAEKDNKYPGHGDGSGAVGFETAASWNAQVNAFLNNEEGIEEKTNNQGEVTKYVRVRRVSERGNKRWYFEEATFDLEALMTQKYIAMYMQPEQWTDMRRYHFSNKRNNYGIGDAQEIVYPKLRRPYNLYSAYWIDGLTDEQQENTWVQRIPQDPDTEGKYNRSELERLGAYNNYKWLQKPMIWAQDRGVRTSLTAE
ncbi:MAG: SusD/RagB family nutrient-binding outer membrane lipoprotein [Muribaculaceae bacterium]|nr:SusD/RagB family nutrient-binding outer membrane lipoprotein [Muribaculaceae bacterium]